MTNDASSVDVVEVTLEMALQEKLSTLRRMCWIKLVLSSVGLVGTAYVAHKDGPLEAMPTSLITVFLLVRFWFDWTEIKHTRAALAKLHTPHAHHS